MTASSDLNKVVQNTLGKLEQQKFAQRLWDRDASLWKSEPEHQKAIRNALRVATTPGFGPRFLHSTGQLHKGGPNTGLLLQITATDSQDLPIPGEPYSFSVLKQAQALGDLQSLQNKGRRVLRVDLGKDVKAGLDRLLKALEGAVHGTQATSAA